jgi:hypothetical protein
MTRVNLTEYDASIAEERLEPHEIEFMGEMFVIPNEREWDVDLAGPISRNQLDQVFVGLLGIDDWRRLREAGRRSSKGKLTMGHLEHIMVTIANAQGLESLGESQDGGDSSGPTGEPLRPTGSGSTGFGSAGRSHRVQSAVPNGDLPLQLRQALDLLPAEARKTIEQAARKATEQTQAVPPTRAADGTARSRARKSPKPGKPGPASRRGGSGT